MKNEDTYKIVFLTLIAGRKKKDALLDALTDTGVQLVNVVYGKGTANANYLQNVLGLVPEENKIVITGLLPKEQVDTVFRMLTRRFNFDKPNTGIAFTIPIEKLSI